MGDPFVPEGFARDWSRPSRKIARVNLRKAAAATGSQQGVVIYEAPLRRRPWAISSRCGHSTSIGTRPRSNGPGKSPLRPIPDWPTASLAAMSAKLTPPKSSRGERLDLDEVDGAGDARLQSVGRRAGSVLIHLTGGKSLPILGFALTKRRDHSLDVNNGDQTIATAQIVALSHCQRTWLSQFREALSWDCLEGTIPSPRQ